MKLRFASAMGLALLCVALPLGALASPGGDEGMIEVGGGVESAPESGDINFLLRVNLAGKGVNSKGQQLVYAHINANIALNKGNSPDDQHLPFLDISFRPIEFVTGQSDGELVNGKGFAILPIQVKRDLKVDENLMVSVTALGFMVGGTHIASKHVAIFAQLVGDALGYKYVNHISNVIDLNSFKILGTDVKAGLMLTANENFSVRIAVGVRGDLSGGFTHFESTQTGLFDFSGHGDIRAESDYKAYAEVKVDIAKYLELFAEASYNGVWNYEQTVRNDESRYWQVMAGAAFIY
ncbi:MAG: hypothetical protein ACXWPM_11105 [Bdellovibrionota bacterium]